MDVVALSGKCDIVNACGVAVAAGATPGATDYTCDNRWHMSTEVLNACTNDGNYPKAWNKPKMAKKHLFDSGVECCAISYPNESCRMIDSCSDPPPTVSAASRHHDI